jgi:hypothetical protein
MIAAYVLIWTEVGQAAVVAAALRDVPGVSEAVSVTGPYDVIARAEARNIDELGRLVVSRVQALGGVARTMTCTRGRAGHTMHQQEDGVRRLEGNALMIQCSTGPLQGRRATDPATPVPDKVGGGTGLAGIRERIQMMGGRVDISSDTTGTDLVVRLPAKPGEECSD